MLIILDIVTEFIECFNATEVPVKDITDNGVIRKTENHYQLSTR